MKLKKLFGAVALGVASMGAANAAILTVTGMTYSNPTTAHIKSTAPSLDKYLHSGAFQTKEDNNSFESWCVDIFQNTYFNQAVSDYTLTTGVAALGKQKASLLERLATESLHLVKDAYTSSAFQLAIWEILNENVGTAYNLSTGNFSAYGASNNSIALAQNWLANLPTTSTYSLSVYQSATRQDLGVFKTSEVPEPATLGILAFGLLGMGLLRKSHTG